MKMIFPQAALHMQYMNPLWINQFFRYIFFTLLLFEIFILGYFFKVPKHLACIYIIHY